MKNIPSARVFTLDHNYMLDYNFYLSRIREGQEGNWLVYEKYYNQPHSPSLFQILYLYLGKIGTIFRLGPPEVYHVSRLIFGFTLLFLTGAYVRQLIDKKWQIWAFLFTITAGSYPILLKIGNFWRFGTYMGWWSAIDSLQRITFIPHVVFGQIFILVFILVYSDWEFFNKSQKQLNLIMQIGWGFVGLAVGIIFPPTLIIVYVYLGIKSVFELFELWNGKIQELVSTFKNKKWVKDVIIPRVIFIFLSGLSFVYVKIVFSISPWSELPLFDIRHRFLLPYPEYARALGIILPLGILGFFCVLIRREKKLIGPIVWILSIGLLFTIFEKVPEQSPLRFTEGLIHIPLGILAGYFFYTLWLTTGNLNKILKLIARFFIKISVVGIIIVGLGVMLSMYLWLTDNLKSKQYGGWLVPIGAQIAYPLKDFMDAVKFIGNNTPRDKVVMTFVTAGNFIPAYAGNYVYIGHINTPDEDKKEGISTKFYSGKMTKNEVEDFLKNERISYIFVGPQEKEYGGGTDILKAYPDIRLSTFYSNPSVVIYKNDGLLK
jgi:hypothetical protein